MNALERLAQQMREKLEPVQKGYIHRALFGGLQVLLERRGQTWRLAIARLASQPSATEAQTVGRAFNVPPGVEWRWAQKSVRNVNIGRGRQPRLKYNVLECTWIERDGEGQT